MPVAKAKKNADSPVGLQRLHHELVALELEGLTPYIPEKWTVKAREMMPGHPNRKSVRETKGAKEPEAEAESRVYRTRDGRVGIPAVSIKAAMVSACRLFDGMTMTEAKLKFRVLGEEDAEGNMLVPIEYETETLREDTPRNASGVADLRYRKSFSNWTATVVVSFLSPGMDLNSVVALLDAAGMVGVGGWRPGSPKSFTGTFGTWRVIGEPARLQHELDGHEGGPAPLDVRKLALAK